MSFGDSGCSGSLVHNSSHLNALGDTSLKKHVLITLLSFFALVSFGRASKAPKLIVLISIDQMRADHLVRYAKEYSAGFKRLTTEGVWYSNADLGYANTSTAPGHATMATGVYPWKSGIVGNNFIDRKANRRVYSVEDSTAMPVEGEGGKRSPNNLLTTAVGDWLKAASTRSRVISISYKDRPAVLMGGKKADYAFWYDRTNGHMLTSSYYTNTLPEWAKGFNAGNWVERNLPAVWTKLKADSVYERYGPDAIEGEYLWDGSTSFPHAFTPAKKFGQAFDSPYGNTMLLDFAREALRGEELGKRGVTDLLCVSLSSTDIIGSMFGPSSHEMIDNLVRLDLAIGTFLTELASAYGRDNLLVLLVGDHGVMPLPEYVTTVEHKFARRFDNKKEVQQKLRQLDSLLRIELKISETVVKEGFINYPLMKEAGIDPRVIERRVRDVLVSVNGVADVYFCTELLDPKTPQRPFLEAYRHSLYPGRVPDFFIRDCENCLNTDAKTGTSHGSPYSYDARVPIVFWGAHHAAKKVDRPVHTVDIAPTLAKILNIQAPLGLDGVVLEEFGNK